jgi:hypothetical protein
MRYISSSPVALTLHVSLTLVPVHHHGAGLYPHRWPLPLTKAGVLAAQRAAGAERMELNGKKRLAREMWANRHTQDALGAHRSQVEQEALPQQVRAPHASRGQLRSWASLGLCCGTACKLWLHSAAAVGSAWLAGAIKAESSD